MREIIETLRAGDHVAFFYRTRQEQFDAVIPYICIGLERKERCLYIADDNSVPMVMNELEQAGVNVAREERNGSLTVATKRETYLRHGIFEPEKMINDLAEEVDRSLSLGFTAFRATGEMTWALALPSSLARLTEYEAKLHARCPEQFIGFCQYNETHFDGRIISDMIRIHPKVIARGRLISNTFYVSPEKLAARDYKQVTVEEMVAASDALCSRGSQFSRR